jgi:cytochrome o ubiquinol oxidase subunit II
MSRNNKILAGVLLGIGFFLVAAVFVTHSNIPVLQPAGPVGLKERNLIYIALLLSAIVVVPVFVMLFMFSWKYREGNTKAKYNPEFDSSRKLEAIWWGIPFAIIAILSVITWNSAHALDPSKPISSSIKPVTIEVVALQWKWLFIYPDQNIASVNFLQFPVNTPVNFEITSDAPMNSFWIPQLGGQIYAMTGMSTQLHLMATKAGDYGGKSANISGKGFSGMTFTARASSQKSFNDWVNRVYPSYNPLSLSAYSQLAKPSENNHVEYFSSVDSSLYDSIISKYMGPQNGSAHENGMAM